jgi:hypothetical protein
MAGERTREVEQHHRTQRRRVERRRRMQRRSGGRDGIGWTAARFSNTVIKFLLLRGSDVFLVRGKIGIHMLYVEWVASPPTRNQ